MNSVVAWFCKSKGFSLIASVVSVLLTLGMTSEGIFVSNLENAFAQHGYTNMTTPGHIMTGGEGMQHDSGQGMSGMSGMTGGGMQHDSGQGMSGMSGMEHGTDHIPGMTNEMCSMGEDMPPHYCEPSSSNEFS